MRRDHRKGTWDRNMGEQYAKGISAKNLAEESGTEILGAIKARNLGEECEKIYGRGTWERNMGEDYGRGISERSQRKTSGTGICERNMEGESGR